MTQGFSGFGNMWRERVASGRDVCYTIGWHYWIFFLVVIVCSDKNVRYHCSDIWGWTKWCFPGRSRTRRAGLHAWWCLWWPPSQPPTRSLHKTAPCGQHSQSGSPWVGLQPRLGEAPVVRPRGPTSYPPASLLCFILHFSQTWSVLPLLCSPFPTRLEAPWGQGPPVHISPLPSLQRPSMMLGTELNSLGTRWWVKEKSQYDSGPRGFVTSLSSELPCPDLMLENHGFSLGRTDNIWWNPRAMILLGRDGTPPSRVWDICGSILSCHRGI